MTIFFVLIIGILIGIAETRRQDRNRYAKRIEELEDVCLEKDAKIDVLIKAMGRSQITINEPRRRN